MKKSILFITSLFLCIFCLKSNAQQSRTEVTWEKMEDVTVPIPPQVHPRLYVRSADLPDLKKRMNYPHVKEVLATLNKLGKDRTPEEEAKVKDRGFRYYFEMRGVTSRVQVQALEYLVYGRQETSKTRHYRHAGHAPERKLWNPRGPVTRQWCDAHLRRNGI